MQSDDGQFCAIDLHVERADTLFVVPPLRHANGPVEQRHQQRLEIVDLVKVDDIQQLLDVIKDCREPWVRHAFILSSRAASMMSDLTASVRFVW